MSDSVNSTHQASGQHLGFSLQTTRCVAYLLEAPESWKISLEVFEDVGAETPDGNRIAEQSKSTHGHNPISDRAVDLWKTIVNWLEDCKKGLLDPDKTKFVIYVSQSKTGKVVEKFIAAQDVKSAKEALCFAREKLWGSYPGYPLMNSVSPSLAPYLHNVFNIQKSEAVILKKIICNFQVICGSGSPQTDLREKFRDKFIRADLIEEVNRYAQGWVKEKLDLLLEAGQPAILKRDEFHAEIHSYVGRKTTQLLLQSVCYQPNPQELNQHMVKDYIRQLELIECEDEDRLQAARCFLQASADRTEWGMRGLIHTQDLEELTEDLKLAWRNCKRKAGILGQTDIEKGQLLYSDCSAYKTKLQGMEPPHYFVSGSYHTLADDQIIGWHPQYKGMLAIRTPNTLSAEEKGDVVQDIEADEN